MTENVLNTLSSAMDALGIDYSLLTNNKPTIVYPYFVGEYTESEGFTEDGLEEATVILTGFARGPEALKALEDAKKSIKNYFTKTGRKFRFNDGSIAVIMYGSSFFIRKEDAELKSIQINLTVKEWSVN